MFWCVRGALCSLTAGHRESMKRCNESQVRLYLQLLTSHDQTCETDVKDQINKKLHNETKPNDALEKNPPLLSVTLQRFMRFVLGYFNIVLNPRPACSGQINVSFASLRSGGPCLTWARSGTYVGSGSSWMWSIRTSCRMQKRQRCCRDFTLLNLETGYRSWTGVGGRPEHTRHQTQNGASVTARNMDAASGLEKHGGHTSVAVTTRLPDRAAAATCLWCVRGHVLVQPQISWS